MTLKKLLLSLIKGGLMICGVIYLVLLVTSAMSSRQTSADEVEYQFAKIRRGTLETLVSSTGTLAAVETVEVGTQVSGTISRILVDYNDHVTRGQILAVLDQSLWNAQVREAEANVNKAHAVLVQAEDEFKRNQPLFEKGFLSAQEFLPVRIGVDTAKAALAAAEASLARAKTNLNYTVIRSPIEGTVIKRNVEAGQTVAASLNTPTLFLIARNLKQMQIEADVDESDIGQIRNGQEVRFTVQSYQDQIFHGRVSQIRLQPRTVSNVVNYTVLVEADNADGLLLPGMTATLDFVVSKTEDALLAPNAALRFQPSEEQADAPPAPAKKSVEAETRGTLYVLHKDGAGLQAIQVTKGESDGISTVVSGSSVSEGLQVISGIKPEVAGKQTNLFSFLRPPRRSSGGRP